MGIIEIKKISFKKTVRNFFRLAIINILLFFIFGLIYVAIFNLFDKLGMNNFESTLIITAICLFLVGEIRITYKYGLMKIDYENKFSLKASLKFFKKNIFMISKNMFFKVLLLFTVPAIMVIVKRILHIDNSAEYVYNEVSIKLIFYNIFMMVASCLCALVWFSTIFIDYIIIENINAKFKDIILMSIKIIKKNIFRWMIIVYSFIPWMFVYVFTFGIAALFILPYFELSIIELYKHRKIDKGTNDICLRL